MAISRSWEISGDDDSWILKSKFNMLTGVNNQKAIGNKELDTKGDLEWFGEWWLKWGSECEHSGRPYREKGRKEQTLGDLPSPI